MSFLLTLKPTLIRLNRLYFFISVFFICPILAQEPNPIQAGVAPSENDYQGDLNVLHYDVEIGLGNSADWIEGIVYLKCEVMKDDPNMRLDFTGLSIQSLSVNGLLTKHIYEKGLIEQNLKGFNFGDTVTIKIHYSGTPDDGLILGENVHGNRTAFVDNWPNRTRFWLPSIDYPADKATINYSIHAPVEWKVIANGYLKGNASKTPADAIGPKGDRMTWSWEVTVPISPYNMVIGAGDLEIRSVGLSACGEAPASQREDECIEVTYWVYPEDVDKAKPSFKRAAEMVDYFTKTVGPFPFEKLANVQSSTRFGGMENASAIFYSENAISQGRNIEGTVSHEIAHQWFGDAVTQADWHHLWLSEGFATYFGSLFFEYADGNQSFQKRMESSRKRVIKSEITNKPIIDVNEKDLFKLLNSNNYPKGGWVLHMLRGYLGNELFFKGIRKYYKKYKYKAVLTEEFQKMMEDVSVKQLDWFFDQWIYKPGFPKLSYEETWYSKSGTKGILEVTILQTQKEEWPIFKIPSKVCWLDDCRAVEINQRKNSFKFNFDQKPIQLGVVDPDGWVLKELTLKK